MTPSRCNVLVFVDDERFEGAPVTARCLLRPDHPGEHDPREPDGTMVALVRIAGQTTFSDMTIPPPCVGPPHDYGRCVIDPKPEA